MNRFTQSMIQVLEWRERKSRQALARLSRTIAAICAEINAMDEVIAAVEARLTANLNARLTGGPSSVATLIELEQHTQTLISGRERVADLKRKSEHKLAELRVRQRVGARRWRRDEVKLTHAKTLARRETVVRLNREAEAQEQAL
jgi:hypothetical protein